MKTSYILNVIFLTCISIIKKILSKAFCVPVNINSLDDLVILCNDLQSLICLSKNLIVTIIFAIP